MGSISGWKHNIPKSKLLKYPNGQVCMCMSEWVHEWVISYMSEWECMHGNVKDRIFTKPKNNFAYIYTERRNTINSFKEPLTYVRGPNCDVWMGVIPAHNVEFLSAGSWHLLGFLLRLKSIVTHNVLNLKDSDLWSL